MLGNFTATAQGYRFIAGTKIKNTGNVGLVADVTVSWDQLGRGPLKEVREVKVPYGRSKNVQFTKIATGDQIDLHQSVGGLKNCRVKVSIVDY